MKDKIVEILNEIMDDCYLERDGAELWANRIIHLYSAGEEDEFGPVDLTDVEPDKLPEKSAGEEVYAIIEPEGETPSMGKWAESSLKWLIGNGYLKKLTRPTVTEGEIEQAWKSWMCTLDNLAKDEQVMLEGDFYAAIKELIDK